MGTQAILAIDAHVRGADVLFGDWVGKLSERVGQLLGGHDPRAPAETEPPLPTRPSAPPKSALLPEPAGLFQRLLGPRYKVVGLIGEGAFGQVWLLYDHVRTAYVAAKTLPGHSREREGMLKILALRHPGLIEVLGFEIAPEKKRIWYFMPPADDLNGDSANPESYLPCTLANYLLVYSGKVGICEYLGIALEICAAVVYLHGRRIVHRDIKPANILRVRGQWKLADIGLLATFGSTTWVGTVPFAPPECPGQPTADIFSLGKVLEAMKDHMAASPVEPQLREIIATATAHDPQQRFQTSSQMHDALEALAKTVLRPPD